MFVKRQRSEVSYPRKIKTKRKGNLVKWRMTLRTKAQTLEF